MKCSVCGQEIEMRLGVRMRPAERTVFDRLSKDRYVSMDTLTQRLGKNSDLLVQHIANIRDRLLETDWTIQYLRNVGYKIVKRK